MRGRTGFTLVELLVVIFIILLISIATLPIVLPALQHRQVSEAARNVQAALVAARDTAVKSGRPAGIRLILDPQFSGPLTFASSAYIPLEPGPEYSVGKVCLGTPTTDPTNPGYLPAYDPTDPRIGFQESKFVGGLPNGIPNEPTSWFWNLRQGDQIRFGEAGNVYTIAGPMTIGARDSAGNIVNSDRFVNAGLATAYQSLPLPLANNACREFVYVVNGRDDDGDGWVDEAFDGIDNDGDGIIDPGFNGVDDNGNGIIDEWQELRIGYDPTFILPNGRMIGPVSGEYEPESFVGMQYNPASFVDQDYRIIRRPVPATSGRTTQLPEDVVIDLTTSVPNVVNGVFYPASLERSRVPVDPLTGYVDIMLMPNGQVTASRAASGAALPPGLPFVHLWLSERQDVHEPKLNPSNGVNVVPQLPMPRGTAGYASQGPNDLGPERRLVTIFPKSGVILTSTPTEFDVTNVDAPYYSAQSGAR